MRHFPIFLDMRGKTVVVSGAGETAAAKLRLLMKTEASIHVYGRDIAADVAVWAEEKRIVLRARSIAGEDLIDARLVYAANNEDIEDARVKQLAVDAGVLVSVVDNLAASEFITPAIIDRDPVTVAIGTEGTAPVLARQIKADIEARLASDLGVLARVAARFRKAAERLPGGRIRRAFWSRYFNDVGRRALERGGEAACADTLSKFIEETAAAFGVDQTGRIILVDAGPGDPELLTIKARNALHDADVVLHNRLVDPRIIELARREAIFINVDKRTGGNVWRQDDIDAEAIAHAKAGHIVVRLKSGDPMVLGRSDEELNAYEAAGVHCNVIPGVTTAIATAVRDGRSLPPKRKVNVMTKIFVPKIVSGNALMTGDAVFMAVDGWSADHRRSQVAFGAADADALLAQAEKHPELVVGPYLVDVTVDDLGTPQPVHAREAIRTSGPSIRPDLAVGGADIWLGI